jgi:hypothetical protein
MKTPVFLFKPLLFGEGLEKLQSSDCTSLSTSFRIDEPLGEGNAQSRG